MKQAEKGTWTIIKANKYFPIKCILIEYSFNYFFFHLLYLGSCFCLFSLSAIPFSFKPLLFSLSAEGCGRQEHSIKDGQNISDLWFGVGGVLADQATKETMKSN